MKVLGTANPEPLSVCTNFFSPFLVMYLMRALLAWKSVQLLQEETSSHSLVAGAYASTSYVFAEANPVSDAERSLTRKGISKVFRVSVASFSIFSSSLNESSSRTNLNISTLVNCFTRIYPLVAPFSMRKHGETAVM